MSNPQLERALTLIKAGDIKAEDVLASTTSRAKLNIKLPKVLNKHTGKETSAPYIFLHDNWGTATNGYMKSIKNKGKGFLESTVDMAYSALKESTARDAATSLTESFDDEHALLYMFYLLSYSFTNFMHLAEISASDLAHCHA